MRGTQGLEVRGVVRSAVDLRHDVIDIGGAQPTVGRRERHDPLAPTVAQQLACPPQTPRRAVPALGRGPSPARKTATLAGGDPEASGARVGGHAPDDIEGALPNR